MSFRIVEVDAARPPAPVLLGPQERGVALVIRHEGRPVGFRMIDATPGTSVNAATMGEAIARAGEVLFRYAIVRELTGDVPAHRTVTIAICTKDRPVLLARCLDSIASLLESSAARAVVTDVLVVDNAPSDDATAEVVRRYPFARRHVEARPGLNFARNAGWREARGEFVAYLDDDAAVDRFWAGGFAAACAAHPDAGAFTGLVLPLVLETEAQVEFERRGGFRRGFLARRFESESAGDPVYPASAGMFGVGCNMVFRRALLERLGGFDEALDRWPLFGAGDQDMLYRVVRAAGILVYDPRLLVFHEHRRTLHQLRRQYYTWGLGVVALMTKIWAAEPSERAKIVRLGRWWTVNQVKTLFLALVGRGERRIDQAAAELWGGLVGACGAYRRSCRQVARLRSAA